MRKLLLMTACLIVSGVVLSGAAGQTQKAQKGQKATTVQPKLPDGQDFIFLGESRPVFVRLHVLVDGKSLEVAWNECVDFVFHHLDVDKDGVLSEAELSRAPAASQFTGGGVNLAGLGRRGSTPPAGPKLADVDANGDGKVTFVEFAAFYRKSGFAPFQFTAGGSQANPLAMLFMGGQGEPSAQDINKAIFELLDTDKDGKLSAKELAGASAVLLQRDTDEDEMVVKRELVVNDNSANNSLEKQLSMALGGNNGQDQSGPTSLLMPVLKPGEATADLATRLIGRYNSGRPSQAKGLSQMQSGLDDATFAQLDVNKDGTLDAAELAAFVSRTPDLEFVMRLGAKKDTEARLEVVAGSLLANKLAMKDLHGLLDLDRCRLEVRPNDQAGADRVTALRQDAISQFKQADANNDGVLDPKEAEGNQRLNALFKTLDRDGDGKVTLKEVNDYYDFLQELQKRVAAGSASLSLGDQSLGLFGLLDTDGDGRLSVREMRQSPNLLKQFDRGNKGYLTRDDLPRTYRLEVRRGAFNPGSLGGLAAVNELYSAGDYQYEAAEVTRGPLWFRKMDRNRDGDVSRKEWLYSEELFRKIDTDGDGLISVEEADKADVLFRQASQKH